MAMFAMETSFLIALAVFAGGLVLLHFGRQPGASLLRAAGLVLLVGSVLSATGTVYAGIRYHVQGDFGSAYPMFAHRWMHGGCGTAGERWMGPHGMLGPGMMGRGPGMMGGTGMGRPGMHGMMGGQTAPAPEPPPAAEKPPQKP